MEVHVTDAVENREGHMTSASAFVEGGIQEAFEDACSICLETFCDSDPSSVTNCRHEFHLQCILEWCQRSSNCPMCWQPISMKNPTSQELLEAVEQERNSRLKSSRNTTIFHHPSFGDIELHLPIDAIDSEIEERINQHLTVAAIRRARHISPLDSLTRRSSSLGRPQFVLVSTPPTDHESQSGTLATGRFVQTEHTLSSSSGLGNTPLNGHNIHINNRNYEVPNPDRAGPSDVQTFPETLKSRFGAMSMRYKESLSKSTRGWREKLFSRNNSMTEFGSDVRREVNSGIAIVFRMMERSEDREDNHRPVTPNSATSSFTEQHNNQGNEQIRQGPQF
ncbi:E3 ubiquitin-protein ligase RHF2A-like [Impatiens glandulifera]|uniref:E3 ubiquitin-protein ligase RHF2A-like n=1 Tax=Impatiens glandulifera TaxID=253017 RepID=UPI001FB1082C|nr:E3 ubiquitin-protein ligase RHF2A-like [Impatiens glandulifera]